MSIPKVMKAAVVDKFREPLSIREVSVPAPLPGEVLVEIVASGVCHTDLHAADGDWPIKPTAPFIPGHEGAGIVVALGAGVTHLKEGDRVGIAWLHSACGHWEFCLSGWETLCLQQKNSGYSVNGSFAQYTIGQADYVARIPKNLSFVDAAPILCAGVTTYKGLKETTTRPGDWVVISGVGGLGHIAIQYAKAMGLHVVAVDLGPEKMALARKLGAEITIDAKTQNPPAEVQKQIGGAHGVLVTAVSTTAFKQAIGMLRRGGTCVLNGLSPGEFPISLAATALLRQHLPDAKVRFANVVDLFRLVPHTEHPHGMTDREFEAIFTPDKPVIFNFHGYPWLIHRLTYRRPGQHNIHVRGYKEQGNINTPLELAICNQVDRFSLAIDAIDRMPRFRVTGAGVREALINQRIACKQHAYEFGIDPPEITDWKWPF
jgi:propanol-preferring alcohol dehydrogenase